MAIDSDLRVGREARAVQIPHGSRYVHHADMVCTFLLALSENLDV